MNSEDRLAFGANLKRIRINAGLSQRQLAKLLYMSNQNIYCYEIGERGPTYETLHKLADILKCSVKDLINSATATEICPPEHMTSGQHIRAICKGCTFWQRVNGTCENACHWGYWHNALRSDHFIPEETECKGFMDEAAGEEWKAEKKRKMNHINLYLTDEDLKKQKAELKNIAKLSGKITAMRYSSARVR